MVMKWDFVTFPSPAIVTLNRHPYLVTGPRTA